MNFKVRVNYLNYLLNNNLFLLLNKNRVKSALYNNRIKIYYIKLGIIIFKAPVLYKNIGKVFLNK